jgi:endonuclease YncB( thermonuclease family)
MMTVRPNSPINVRLSIVSSARGQAIAARGLDYRTCRVIYSAAMIRLLTIGALVLTAASSLAAREQAAPIIGRASVIDGDTIEIRGQRIRLFGIDAPEGRQTCTDQKGATYRCGQKAAQALDDRISDGVVTCEPKDRDRYGRVVAICRAYGEDLSAWMAGLGWALAYRQYSPQYVPAEELAERRKAGMWSGQFVPPWEWRAKGREQNADLREGPQ